ncbi:hypothetical protein BS50DRAFT_362619 [Corynespora cassiicola Philippines]|uniref:Uncharacterized protein n=1 Tax=Corynespora cassiicola Philippines TaxID=1448308 RepID=A0A2T2NSM4_CORCC|nr:hypothetical protein BS50DRAFT_362619 [Corynespora cassiicola Philippines]
MPIIRRGLRMTANKAFAHTVVAAAATGTLRRSSSVVHDWGEYRGDLGRLEGFSLAAKGTRTHRQGRRNRKWKEGVCSQGRNQHSAHDSKQVGQLKRSGGKRDGVWERERRQSLRENICPQRWQVCVALNRLEAKLKAA